MKISALRKIYPSLSKEMKNIKWRPLTDKEIEAALKERQKVCDCYSNAARYALFHSEKGSEILKKRIRIQQTDSNEPAYKFLLTVNGKDEIYRVNPKDYIKKYFKLFKRYNEEPAGSGNFAESETRNFNLAADIAICKLIKKHPEQKGIFLRLFKFPYAANQLCEFNRPSRAFEWFSGIVPEKITETKIHKSLKDKPKETKSKIRPIF